MFTVTGPVWRPLRMRPTTHACINAASATDEITSQQPHFPNVTMTFTATTSQTTTQAQFLQSSAPPIRDNLGDAAGGQNSATLQMCVDVAGPRVHAPPLFHPGPTHAGATGEVRPQNPF